ncbi:AAA family ATPase [Sphingomonas alba]|uniref:AAA family ATPase n=1 Tax=Sphingomonas alba TaxID=2908208 RepID=A0ABT0RI62_9SPHN|nr:AAA family ATPase [Sphingomonas alba]MCL6682317.1 AAA family ATPase [Sphingomonas alba]
MKRGFILGKFLPPHAGHVTLIQAARALVDELTILVCSTPGDTIPGEERVQWLRQLFPTCTIAWHNEELPRHSSDSPDFWKIWRGLITETHPKRIDYFFGGEAYGADLAREFHAFFVPLGARVLEADQSALGGLSGEKIRADPWKHWDFLPGPVRSHYAMTICLHGVESVGKSMLAERLAQHYRTLVVPEYGRTHCETHGTDCRELDLLLIGEAQQAMIEAARPWCNRLLIADTDALMTAAWSQMMIGYMPDQLICHRKADLYLVLGTDAPFIDDGTRIYGEPETRARFDRVARDVLRIAQSNIVEISGNWDERFHASCAAIEGLIAARGLSIS